MAVTNPTPQSNTFLSKPPIERYEYQCSEMEAELQSFIPQYRELAMFISPRRGRFFVQDRNKGDKRFNNIINSTATKAHRTAVAGMLAGTMPSSRPFFMLGTPDPDLMKAVGVKEWLFKVASFIRQVLVTSNFYVMAPTMIAELLQFGTSLMFHVDDYDDVSRFYTQTIGSFMIAQDAKFRVNKVFRKFEWTVKMIVDEFGLPNVNETVKNAYDKGDYGKWYPVNHIVEPNTDYAQTGPRTSKQMRYKSCYYQPDQPDKSKLLNESGYNMFPCYAPRWEVTGEDIYGTNCPAMTALGDIKGLQIQEKEKAKAIQKSVSPPLKGPPSLKNIPVNVLPGGMNIYQTDPNDKDGLRPVYMVNPQLQELRGDIKAIEDRIDDDFFVNLWLAITNMEGIQPQNELTIQQRDQERLLQLGPVLERLHGEFLTQVITRIFLQCIAAKIPLFLNPPPALAGSMLKITYISSLAIAQRAVATQGIDRFTAYVGGLIQAGFDARAKFNADRAVEIYGDLLGVDPDIIVPDDIANAQRQAAAQAAAQQQALQAAPDIGKALNQVGGAVKQLSDPAARAALAGRTAP